ncbi:UPF0183-domain-containing protein [Hortaea werneckii]|uniref:Uncharacterized protein n=1 Tax=Hortaea werneckii TaxID=91943 RepID=A0A3M7J9N0_HORWE|nr:UPF0183-domain-containing protein [Hortaea werneckii]KAI6834014.1 UPF0183-domain-containing protein [Hortaea werneckii]KAI6916640.1 UPF0183-domain-containing protein [Hortaea werneckii]KAI6939511.1 UPF0183-domain-containing protein [Hortaea werneckii]KAI6974508.1 UPF0183-domain-containing protein [Hortaea werneckii]
MATPGTVIPGHSLGQLCLGASLHNVLSLIKEDKQTYPAIDLHYSQTDPLDTPVVVGLPANGVRLRFDGADQRLRLIEVLGFKKINLLYKGSELVKGTEDGQAAGGPAFKRVYSLFGPSYPGEYLPPKNKRDTYGTYVLSWPGVAFNFPLQHAAWSREKDHVSLLGSHVAGAATNMALFEGKSWPEARKDLFVREPEGPRLSSLASRAKDSLPEEIDFANILGDGRIELARSNGNPPFVITLNQTTPQDLTTELGPPDAVHKREGPPGTPEPTTQQHRRAASSSRPLSNGRSHPGSQPSSYSSTGTDTFDTDFDPGEAEDDPAERASRERFWCYFSHGLDILVGPPSDHATPYTTETQHHLATSHRLVVTRVVIHGNVPGSYAFNRHRRLRWSLSLPSPPNTTKPHHPTPDHVLLLSSEHNFDTVIKPALLTAFAQTRGWFETEMAKGKVVNRTWSGSGGIGGGMGGSESGFFLPDEEQEVVVEGEGGVGGVGGGNDGSETWLGNTKLFSFPGLVVEVLGCGAVGGLTVY